ncbi:MAG: alpha/beta hydrolase [Streptococcaceae bacterium]|jgi:pimeloyl-ACP methyl ester carboxylesterase|nr:alpha/beta hydrolase [Streptococcaceae bacterium]
MMKNISGFIHNQEARIYYEVKGSGLPLVMIHGNRQNLRVFHQLANQLAKDFRVYLLDSRGHGSSDLGSQELSISLMANDVAVLIKKLHLKKVILFGFSDGGNIALKIASDYPEVVVLVIAISPNTHLTGLRTWVSTSFQTLGDFYHGLEKIGLPFSKHRQLTDILLQSELTDEELRKIQAPVLILTGTKDIIIVEHSLEIVESIPNAQVKIYQNEGHGGLFRSSQKYLQDIYKFLAEKGKNNGETKE